MARPRWAWANRNALPLFLASVVAVLLSGMGLLAAVSFDWGGGTDPAPGIDDCLLGRWRMVSHTEELAAGGIPLRLSLVGEGAVYEFGADGTGSADYGDATRFESQAIGEAVPATVAGTLSFRYEAAGGIFQVVQMLHTDATFTVDLLGAPVESRYALSTSVRETYQCEGDTIAFSAADRGYAAEYRRI